MAISQVIQFTGNPDLLVWKSPQENFNTTSQLIVDPTHEALLVLNGYAADLFAEGKHTLSTGNIPFLRKIIEIPTGGESAFPCQIYYINKVHQMDLLWGTKDAIPLEDPLYDIFLHVMIHGSMSYSISDSRKFLLKLAGLKPQFTADELVKKFRGIIAKHVKDCVSKIMINGKLSYFMISANLMEISDVLQERLASIFDEYGVEVEFFNVEAISVPKEDYDSVSAAKERRTSRLIEGYTWQEERQMMIAEKFAGNEGSMGAMGGMMGGAMGGVVMGSTISEVARNALGSFSATTTSSQGPLKDLSGIAKPTNNTPFDVNAFLKTGSGTTQTTTSVQQPTQTPVQQTSVQQSVTQSTMMDGSSMMDGPADISGFMSGLDMPMDDTPKPAAGGKFCSNCGNPLSPKAKFCPECGTKVQSNTCPGCGSPIKPGMKFCPECGQRL